jgi:UDP-glucuronate 4-epimerase
MGAGDQLTLVTGAAGFIGSFVARALVARGEAVVGLDNLNDYYDPDLKRARLALLADNPRFTFENVDLVDALSLRSLFTRFRFTRVVHLAAQAGVRYSMTHPHAYVDSNISGFLNILEAVRARSVEHVLYASSSSVYGANSAFPFAEEDRVDRPINLYAVSKRANELMANVYAMQFGVPLTGLRFFTVYGPWGRPDMAVFKFTRALLAGESIDVYNHGDMQRDFTYVEDVVDGTLRVLDRLPRADQNGVQHRVFNIGNHRPEPLLRLIELLGRILGREPRLNLLPMQPGDVKATFAETATLRSEYGWIPTTSIDEGLPRFVKWYREYYQC